MMNDKQLSDTLNKLEMNSNIHWYVERQGKDRFKVVAKGDGGGLNNLIAEAQYTLRPTQKLTFTLPRNIDRLQLKAILEFYETPEKDRWYECKPLMLTRSEMEIIAQMDSGPAGYDTNFLTMNDLIGKAREALGEEWMKNQERNN